ncbi:MAG: class I SAM-dependent methyltransferase [Thermoguttaceae bacterium]|jgi:SAM-dependent methyltransferase
METIRGDIYDFPKYYDVLFGSDWRAEYDFLLKCFAKHAARRVRRLFEPACGTGRLLIKFAQAGYEVEGNDLNPKAVAYCNARLAKHGFPPTAVVGDMSAFHVARKHDAAFNMINSFRHLQTEEQASGHLKCVAKALAKGGLYILGLHLTPGGASTCQHEAWSARRGNLCVNSEMQSLAIDRRRRQERVRMTFHVYTPNRQFRLEDEFTFRTYTAGQFQTLLGKVPELKLVETCDFAYQVDHPIQIDRETEDVIYILRKR